MVYIYPKYKRWRDRRKQSNDFTQNSSNRSGGNNNSGLNLSFRNFSKRSTSSRGNVNSSSAQFNIDHSENLDNNGIRSMRDSVNIEDELKLDLDNSSYNHEEGLSRDEKIVAKVGDNMDPPRLSD